MSETPSDHSHEQQAFKITAEQADEMNRLVANPDAEVLAKAAGAMVVAAAETTPNKEDQRDPRLVKLFAPTHNQQTETPSETDSFEGLWDTTEETEEEANVRLQKYLREASERERNRPKEPTEQSMRDARMMLMYAEGHDPKLEAIVNKFVKAGEPPVDAIRTNSDLRYALGNYLLNTKMPQILRRSPLTMPARVLTDTEKNPNHPGYSHIKSLRSREYTVLLALSMLDGTFIDPGPGDPIERKPENRDGEQGQHRAAAQDLLLYDERDILT